MAKENKKKKLVWLAGIISLLLIIIIVWAIVTRETAQAPEAPEVQEENEEVNIEKDEDDMSGWKIYENKEYGFSFKYPGEWEIYDEKNKKIVFIDISRKKIEDIEKKFQEYIKKTGGSDSLPESDYHKILFEIEKIKNNEDMQKIIKEKFLINDQQKIFELNHKTKEGYYLENKEWERQLIFVLKIDKQNLVLWGSRYIEYNNDSLDSEILKKIFKSIK